MKGSQELKIVAASADDEEEVFSFLERNFFPDEPLNSSIKRVPRREDFKPVTFLKEGLSLKAYATLDGGQERLAGVVINKVVRRDAQWGERPPENSPAVHVFDILERLHKMADIWSLIETNEAFNIVILSVDADFRRLSIGRRLAEEALGVARSRGFSHVTVECSSKFSARMMDKLGFDAICRIRYDDFTDANGRVVFAPNEPHDGIVCCLKAL